MCAAHHSLPLTQSHTVFCCEQRVLGIYIQVYIYKTSAVYTHIYVIQRGAFLPLFLHSFKGNMRNPILACSSFADQHTLTTERGFRRITVHFHQEKTATGSWYRYIFSAIWVSNSCLTLRFLAAPNSIRYRRHPARNSCCGSGLLLWCSGV